jgi:hypothetical protein
MFVEVENWTLSRRNMSKIFPFNGHEQDEKGKRAGNSCD